MIEVIAAASLIASAFIQALHIFYSLGYSRYNHFKYRYNNSDTISNSNPYPYITIAIPIKNEDPNILRETLESCLKIEWPRDRIEILVISDDPVERREEIRKAVEDLRGHGNAIKLIFRDKPDGGRIGALNLAIKEARGDILLLLDVDTKPSQGIVRRAVDMISGGCDAVVFRWRGHYTFDTRLARALSTAMEFIVGSLYRGRAGIGCHLVPLGSGTAYKRSALIDVGGWDSGIVQDDYWMGIKLFERGLRICYCDEEYVEVLVTSTYRAFKIQQCRWSFGAVQAIRKGIGKIRASKAPLWKKLELMIYGLQYIPTIAIAISTYIYPILLIFHIGPDPLESIPHIFILWLIISIIYIVRYIEIVMKRQNLQLIEAIKRLGTSSAATSSLSLHIAINQIQGMLLSKYRYTITPKGSKERLYNGIGLSEMPEILSIVALSTGIAISIIKGYILSTIWLVLLISGYIYTLLVIARGK
ncbi:MAG: glycosyltransferase family 2 protein [Sulfolobales archaeon]